MSKISIVFLMTVAAFCLNCSKTETNTATVNKTNTTAPTNTTTAQTNKPANTTAPTNSAAPANDASKTSNPDLDFTLVNKTGYSIKEVFVGASGTGEWAKEDEVLKGRTFANGNSLEIKFSPKATAPLWDVKVTWADNSGSEEWTKLKLSEIEKVTLVYDKDKDETSAITE